MQYRYILVFLLLSYAVHAEDDVTVLEPEHAACTGYNDSFDARVIDANLRPVPGADVIVTYDRGATFGPQYYATPAKRTNAAGIVHFDLINQGTNTRDLDCSILVNASVAGSRGSTTIYATEHGSTVDVRLPGAYKLNFYVRDETGKPLRNATVTIAEVSRSTDEDGLAAFVIGAGSYEYLASYLDGSQAGTVAIRNDTTFEAVLRAYNVTVEVTDDFGNRLPATLFIFNETFQLENGLYVYQKTFGTEIPYRTEYNGLIRTGTIVPATSSAAHIVYDVHAPLFGDIKPEVANGRYRLIIPVSDPGSAAEGVDVQSIRVEYRVEPAEAVTPWNPAVTFTSGRGVFTAEFPNLPPDSIVSFRAQVSDLAGNKASIEGRFSTLHAQTPANNTQNQTNTQSTSGQEQGIPLIYIFVGAIVALLIVYVVFRIKAQGSGGG